MQSRKDHEKSENKFWCRSRESNPAFLRFPGDVLSDWAIPTHLFFRFNFEPLLHYGMYVCSDAYLSYQLPINWCIHQLSLTKCSIATHTHAWSTIASIFRFCLQISNKKWIGQIPNFECVTYALFQIITAAHCVHHNGKRITNFDYLEVRAGFIRQSSHSPYEQNIRVMRVVIHPNYSSKSESIVRYFVWLLEC